MFFLPFMTKNTIEQVNYDVFLTQMQNKNISQAEVNEDVIYFYLKDEDKSDKAGTTIFSENTQKVYSTVRMDDPQLVERLYNAGASFGEVKPKEVSPWFSTLVMFVVFFLLWQFVMKKAMSKMGGIGNAMSFGKSNAKVYVKAQTGKTFKEHLMEKRLTKAATLLKSTALSVGDIIVMVGYENTSYFYRIFTEKYGMSPKAYRQLK